MSSDDAGQCHRGSFICSAGHELRVTKRCTRDDLKHRGAPTFTALLRHEIVKALCEQRARAVRGTNTVGPAAGEDTLWVLRRGHDHRGATWFDAEEQVVWLCAYRTHRSGESRDAFPYFDELRRASRMRPNEADYQAVFDDRAEQFAAVVGARAPELLAAARAQPGVELRGVIGHGNPVGVLVHIVDTLEQTFVAVAGRRTSPAQFQVLLAVLYPDRAFQDWEWEPRLPTRELDIAAGEYCLSILHG